MMKTREFYDFVTAMMNTVDAPEKEDALAYIQKQIAALDAKNAKTREKAAEKKAANHELRDKIYDILGTENAVTVQDILDTLADSTLTPSKVVAQISPLVREGYVEKTMVKVEDRKLTGYLRAKVPEIVADGDEKGNA